MGLALKRLSCQVDWLGVYLVVAEAARASDDGCLSGV